MHRQIFDKVKQNFSLNQIQSAMENQENQDKTPEQEEKKSHDYAELRKRAEEAEQKGMSYFFLAANTSGLICVADAKRSEIRKGLVSIMKDDPEYFYLFKEAFLETILL